jgi:BolA family transcriptional regulator, general stress-responsive regulator
MTDQYARMTGADARLDKVEIHSAPHDVIDCPTQCTYAQAMGTRDLIAEKLSKAFTPTRLDVIDESHLHVGHVGHRSEGESHFRVRIVADAFTGKSRIERHRMINETLTSELKGGVHALAIEALAPPEADSRPDAAF